MHSPFISMGLIEARRRGPSYSPSLRPDAKREAYNDLNLQMGCLSTNGEGAK